MSSVAIGGCRDGAFDEGGKNLIIDAFEQLLCNVCIDWFKKVNHITAKNLNLGRKKAAVGYSSPSLSRSSSVERRCSGDA